MRRPWPWFAPWRWVPSSGGPPPQPARSSAALSAAAAATGGSRKTRRPREAVAAPLKAHPTIETVLLNTDAIDPTSRWLAWTPGGKLRPGGHSRRAANAGRETPAGRIQEPEAVPVKRSFHRLESVRENGSSRQQAGETASGARSEGGIDVASARRRRFCRNLKKGLRRIDCSIRRLKRAKAASTCCQTMAMLRESIAGLREIREDLRELRRRKCTVCRFL